VRREFDEGLQKKPCPDDGIRERNVALVTEEVA
jgi:hypothetical protein